MITVCQCTKPHVRRVTLGPLSIIRPGGTYWEAARPGGTYLVGHGLHFYTWAAAIHYALGTTP